ncbi:response regulator transcription factor [Piscibacillus salipiscarius]|uniref:response regulator transcription factor n=1 Tax=Piscibacillus salipiscarius TaxID=299480 RepID=UPI0006D14E3B|nr:LuxR C-terminal-related transcriptional regulator [Piscibacillus salipiscarius]
MPYEQYFSIDYFLKNLISSRQLPIEWAAAITQEEGTYVVEKWFNNMNQNLIVEDEPLKARSIYALSELLINQMPEDKKRIMNTISLPYQEGTLLICANTNEIVNITPFITYALHIFENGRESIKKQKDEHHWKDSVIMFNESIINSNDYDEAIEAISEGYVKYLPFERCALFSYSMNEGMGFGLYGYQIDTNAIQNITEDIDNLPIIQNNLNIVNLFKKTMSFLQPIYIKDATLGFPRKYVEQFQLQSIVVAPIFSTSSNQLLGAAILDQGPNQQFKLTHETFSALIKFGKTAGELLSKYQQHSPHKQKASFHLSPRELEVLKLMSEGASTTEAASQLMLSEYTVRDYVSAIIQKMDARNRTEAVAKAIRSDLI